MKPEQVVSQQATAHFARALDGLFVHVPNEGAYNGKDGIAWGQVRRRMGVMAGWPDHQAFWTGGLALLEAKRPGWKPSSDKRWREGAQPVIHRKLRDMGFAVGIFRSVEEADVLLAMAGAPLRFRVMGPPAKMESWMWQDWS